MGIFLVLVQSVFNNRNDDKIIGIKIKGDSVH